MRRVLSLSVTTLFLFSLLFGYAQALSMSEAVLAKFAEQERYYQLPTGVLAKIAKYESGGNANAVNPGPTKASGLFQWLAGSWYYASSQTYGSPRHPNDRFNPFIAAEVTGWALGQAKSRNGGIIQQAGVDMSVGLYMSHFLGIGGANKFFAAYIQNPNANAAQIFPVEAAANRQLFSVGSGRLVDMVNDFARKMNVPGVTNITGYNGNYDGDTTGRIMDIRGANLLSQPYRGPVPPPDPTRTFQETYAQNGAQPGGNPIVSSGSPLGQILVQPKSVSSGGMVLVSWTSISMSTGSTCQVFAGSEAIAQANEGVKTYIIPTSAIGSLSFFQRCTTAGGASQEFTTSISVQ